jgi:hypothetical protein
VRTYADKINTIVDHLESGWVAVGFISYCCANAAGLQGRRFWSLWPCLVFLDSWSGKRDTPRKG